MADFLPPSNDRHSSGKPYDRITQNPMAKISITPPQLGFGSIPAGEVSLSQYVTVINVGDKDVTLTDVIVGGSYAISHEPVGVLKPGEEFQITVTFEPSGTGVAQGSLTVEAGAVEGGRVVRLLGSGAGDDPIDDNSLKANAMAVGINPTSNNLGVFTGTIIPADRTVKQALQILSNYSIGLKTQGDGLEGSLFDTVDEFSIKYNNLMSQVADAEAYAAQLKTQADAATAAIIALGGDVNTLETVVSTQGAAITTSQLSVTNILGSVAQHELTLIAQDSRINTVQTVTDSHELNLAEIETTLSTQNASITNHQTAITSLTGSVASMGTTLTAEQAKIVTNANAISALGTSVATMNTTLTTGINNNSASITSQSTAISTLTDSMATMNTTLSASIAGNTSAISTQSTVIAGLGARYGVDLNVNGHITGFRQNNNGASGSFVVTADRFAIVDPGGGTPFVPFEVVGGITRIKEAVIDTLTVGKLTNGNLGANVTLDGTFSLGAGRIVFNNGSVMKVAGLGFGTTNQFIEWFGPAMAINLCSEANATQYLKTDGSAYFGGSLSAGLLTNSGQTSDLATNASIIVGPFGTNGNPIIVAVSWDYSQTYSKIYAADSTGLSQFNADVATFSATSSNGSNYSGNISETVTASTLTLARKIGAGSFSNIASGSSSQRNSNFNGVKPVVGDSPGSSTIQTGIVITFSYTDNAGGVLDREFQATLARGWSFGGGGTIRQRVGIVATEE